MDNRANMARSARPIPGGNVFCAHNRAAAGRVLFPTRRDCVDFSRLIHHTLRRHPVHILGYCLMPDGWQFVLWPARDGEVAAFLHALTLTHAKHWHAAHPVRAAGRLYRGRFRSFPVQAEAPWYAVLRHVERAPVRAGFVDRVEDWPWSELASHLHPGPPHTPLPDGPVSRPADWVAYVNQEPPAAEAEAVRRSEARGCPFGSADWQRETAIQLGLGFTLRPRGRPRKGRDEVGTTLPIPAPSDVGP
jgi:putative transposase